MMERPNISKVLSLVRISTIKYSPEILIGISTAGMITTTVMVVRATSKVLILIGERKKEIGTEELKAADAVKTTWLCYILAVIMGTLSIACLIRASSVDTRRSAVLAAVYTLSESILKDYQGKVAKIFEEKKRETAKDAVAKNKIEKNPVVTKEVITTEKGNTLCYDATFGRYLKGDIGRIKRTECELNRQMCDEMYVSLSDLYYEVGLDNTKIGDELGWNIDNGYADLSFSSQLVSDGALYLVIDHDAAPGHDFSELV